MYLSKTKRITFFLECLFIILKFSKKLLFWRETFLSLQTKSVPKGALAIESKITMSNTSLDDAIEQTQSLFGSLFAKPKCSKKHLSKPPFRYV